MRIAIPTDDQITLSAHTGRCAGFLIYSFEGNETKREEYRANTAGHAQRQDNDEHHEEQHHHHDHSGMIQLLRDCDTVLAVGMGPRLINDLEAEGIQIVFSYEHDVAKAVAALAHGELIKDQPRSRCRH